VANALVYRTHDPAEFAPKVEEIVRKDVGSPVALRYRVESAEASRAGARGMLADIGRLAIGGRSVPLARLEFDLPWHREATLSALATRVGVNAIVANLWFEVVLGRPVDAPVEFTGARIGSGGSFTGGASAARLATVPELSKRVGKLLRQLAMFGAVRFETTPAFSVDPDGDESRLRITTLAHTGGIMIAHASTEAGEVLAVAKAMEAALPARLG
jgi:hypothetical protein